MHQKQRRGVSILIAIAALSLFALHIIFSSIYSEKPGHIHYKGELDHLHHVIKKRMSGDHVSVWHSLETASPTIAPTEPPPQVKDWVDADGWIEEAWVSFFDNNRFKLAEVAVAVRAPPKSQSQSSLLLQLPDQTHQTSQ